MANIREVARLAHVSPATVSRILNDSQIYKTTDETRERVLRAVTELGYKPLVRKRPLKPDPRQDASSFSVGVLLAATRGKYSDPYYLSILGGIEAELARLGGVVSLVQTEQELEEESVLSRVLGAVSACNANVLTITQSLPIHGKASIMLSIDLGQLNRGVDQMMEELSGMEGVENVRLLALE